MANPPPLPEQPVDLIEGAIIATLAGRQSVAEAILSAITVPNYATAPRFTVLNPEVVLAETRPRTRRNATITEKLALFRRDSWTCRYCGARTILAQVLYILSSIYPRVFPADTAHWGPPTHPVYWGYTTHYEHVVALAGGGSEHSENLITACARCQYGKNSTPIVQLGFTVLDIPRTDWDGLSHYLKALHAVPSAVKRSGTIAEWQNSLTYIST